MVPTTEATDRIELVFSLFDAVATATWNAPTST